MLQVPLVNSFMSLARLLFYCSYPHEPSVSSYCHICSLCLSLPLVRHQGSRASSQQKHLNELTAGRGGKLKLNRTHGVIKCFPRKTELHYHHWLFCILPQRCLCSSKLSVIYALWISFSLRHFGGFFGLYSTPACQVQAHRSWHSFTTYLGRSQG
jgi:hypothetical protein